MGRSLIKFTKTSVQKEVTAWIARQVQLNATGFVDTLIMPPSAKETQDIM